MYILLPRPHSCLFAFQRRRQALSTVFGRHDNFCKPWIKVSKHLRSGHPNAIDAAQPEMHLLEPIFTLESSSIMANSFPRRIGCCVMSHCWQHLRNSHREIRFHGDSQCINVSIEHLSYHRVPGAEVSHCFPLIRPCSQYIASHSSLVTDLPTAPPDHEALNHHPRTASLWIPYLSYA